MRAPSERPPTLTHQHQAILAMQKNVLNIRAELGVLQSVIFSSDPPPVAANKSASVHKQEAHIRSVEAGA